MKNSSERLSAWGIAVHDLVAKPGQMRKIHTDFPAPKNLGLQMIEVPEQSPVMVDIRLESVVEGILVTGEAEAELVAHCSRCLSNFDYHDEFSIQELVYYPNHAPEEDSYLIVDDILNLEPLTRDAIVLGLPFQPLCTPDCLGLCPECGFNLNQDPKHEHETKIDQRWAALQGLNEQFFKED